MVFVNSCICISAFVIGIVAVAIYSEGEWTTVHPHTYIKVVMNEDTEHCRWSTNCKESRVVPIKVHATFIWHSLYICSQIWLVSSKGKNPVRYYWGYGGEYSHWTEYRSGTIPRYTVRTATCRWQKIWVSKTARGTPKWWANNLFNNNLLKSETTTKTTTSKPICLTSASGVLDASTNAELCVHIQLHDGKEPMSEDCLFLNIYRPRPVKENRAVMVNGHVEKKIFTSGKSQ